MSVDCYNPYGCEWSIGQLLQLMDWVVRLDLTVLGLMLAYTLVVVGRNSFRFRSARDRCRKFAVHLYVTIGNLKGIGSAAPLLGLLGTCFGIINTLFRGYVMEKHALMAILSSRAAAAILPAALGIVVAVAAIWSHNYLCREIELLDAELGVAELNTITYDVQKHRVKRRLQKLPLAPRLSGLPSFPLILVPILAFAVAALIIFASFNIPLGLYVHLSRMGTHSAANHVQPGSLHVRVAGRSRDGSLLLFVDSKRMPLTELEDSVTRHIRTHPDWIVDANDDVAWADVANLIDLLKRHGDVLLLPR